MKPVFHLFFRARPEPIPVPSTHYLAIPIAAVFLIVMIAAAGEPERAARAIVLSIVLLCGAAVLFSFIAPSNFMFESWTHYKPTAWGRAMFWITALTCGQFAFAEATEHMILGRVAESESPILLQQSKIIREKARSPLDQVRLAEIAMLHCIQYDSAAHVYGRDHAPSLPEMFARRRASKWVYPRGDCKARAVYLGALLNTLGFKWAVESSMALQHTWVRVKVDGLWYDLGLKQPTTRAERVKHWMYSLGALRRERIALVTTDDLPLLSEITIQDAPWAGVLGLFYPAKFGGHVRSTSDINWETRPLGDDYGVRTPAAAAGFPFGEPL